MDFQIKNQLLDLEDAIGNSGVKSNSMISLKNRLLPYM